MKNLYYLSLLLFCVACGPKAPTNEQLKDLCRNAAFAVADRQEEAGKSKAFQEVVEKSVKEFDMNKIALEQIHFVFQEGGFPLSRYLRDWLAPVLEQKAKLEGKEGAGYTFYRWRYLPSADNYSEGKEMERTAYKAVVTHLLMADFLLNNNEAMTDVINGATRLKADTWVELGIFDHIKSLLDLTLSDESVFASMGVFNTAFTAEKLSAEEKDEIRQKVLKQYTNLLDNERYAKGRRRALVEEAIQYLQGPYATGTLVGNKAPGLDIIWISGGKEKSLDDLKGKVVVLDFWATKCAPCVSIFPNMRELEKRYAKYPVEIIGVTSIMGYHVDMKHGKTIKTEGKPDYEIELMQALMKDMEITWRVAFTEQNVMNMDYGVTSIPHIVILDAEGNVRYNGTDPFEAPYHKAEKIDALLKEAGSRYPSSPMETVDYSKNQNESL